jgi:uncharacterized protein
MKYVLLYEAVDDVATKAPPHFPAHKARLDEFHGRGDLLMVGTMAGPETRGALAVFRTRESAEEFARDDPFVVNGVVRRYEVLGWDEVLTAE